MNRALPLVLAAVACSASAGVSQTLTGTYTGQGGDGRVLTLTLEQAGQAVRGSLAAGDVTFQLEAEVEDGSFFGIGSSSGGSIYMEGTPEGNQLVVIVAEIANGDVSYESARELRFARSGASGAPAVTPSPARQGNPLGGASAGGGNPLAGAAASDPYAGTFAGGGISLTLSAGGDGYTGTLTAQGSEMPVRASRQGERLHGQFQSGGTTYMFEARLQGAQLTLMSDGQTYALERQGAGVSANPLAGGASQPQGGSAGASSAQDQQLTQLLLSSRWCHFSYSAVPGTSSSGSSYSETVTFSQDGTVVIQTGGESYSSGAAGSVAGQSGGGQVYRWRVQGGVLSLSADGYQWVPVNGQVSYNSNGYPILTGDGKEYSQC